MPTAPTIEDDVRHLQFNHRELNDLMNVVRLNVRERITAAGALLGKYFRYFCRAKALLPRPCPLFLGLGVLWGGFFALGEGIVTGRRLVGSLGIQLERGFKFRDTLPERLDFTVQDVNISQHQPGSVHDDFVRQRSAYRNWSPHTSTMRIN